jgi:hypothetical protein
MYLLWLLLAAVPWVDAHVDVCRCQGAHENLYHSRRQLRDEGEMSVWEEEHEDLMEQAHRQLGGGIDYVDADGYYIVDGIRVLPDTDPACKGGKNKGGGALPKRMTMMSMTARRMSGTAGDTTTSTNGNVVVAGDRTVIIGGPRTPQNDYAAIAARNMRRTRHERGLSETRDVPPGVQALFNEEEHEEMEEMDSPDEEDDRRLMSGSSKGYSKGGGYGYGGGGNRWYSNYYHGKGGYIGHGGRYYGKGKGGYYGKGKGGYYGKGKVRELSHSSNPLASRVLFIQRYKRLQLNSL